jgi:hypothetical protein
MSLVESEIVTMCVAFIGVVEHVQVGDFGYPGSRVLG